MHVIDRVADPELSELSSRVTSALIDGTDTPDFTFQLADELDRERTRPATCCSPVRTIRP